MQSGEFFTDKDLSARSKVAVLGTTVAAKLFGDEDPIGKSIRIETTPFTVVGLLASKGSTGMGNDQDDVVMVPLDTAINRLTKDKKINSIEMSVTSEDLMTEAQAEVTAIMRESHKLADGATADFDVMNQEEIIATASQTSADAHHPPRGDRGRLAHRGRHRHHEHHARVGDRAHPGDRHPHVGRREKEGHTPAVPLRVGDLEPPGGNHGDTARPAPGLRHEDFHGHADGREPRA